MNSQFNNGLDSDYEFNELTSPYDKFSIPPQNAVIYNTSITKTNQQMENDILSEAMEKDYEYMKSMFPQIIRKIMVYVDDHCDRMEHDSSVMYDQYPDNTHIDSIVNTIYDAVKDLDVANPDLQMEQLDGNPLTSWGPRQCRGLNCPPPPYPDYDDYGRPNWMKALIRTLLWNEMMHRRNRYRRRKRRFY